MLLMHLCAVVNVTATYCIAYQRCTLPQLKADFNRRPFVTLYMYVPVKLGLTTQLEHGGDQDNC